MGGDSIAAINVVSACRREDYTLIVSDILKMATLDRIATRMTKISIEGEVKWKSLEEYKPPTSVYALLQEKGITSDEIDYIYPSPPGQAEFLTQGRKDDQSWVLTAARPFPAHHDVQEYIRLIHDMTCVNDILRTSFTYQSGYGWIAVVFKKPAIDFTVQKCQLSDRDRIIEEIKKRPFKFSEPFVRYVIFQYPDNSREIIIKMDHGLWDGTSLRIFDDVILALQKNGKAPVNTEFKDFALNQWRSDKAPARQFWKTILKGKRGAYPTTTNPTTNRIFRQSVDRKLNVDTIASCCGVTPAIVFQGAFQLWLASCSGHLEASYDYLLTGRNVALPNPQTINGPCATFLPFRLPVAPSQTLHAFLTATQDFFWSAAEHATLSLDAIYIAASLPRLSLANTCLFLFQPFDPVSTAPVPTEMRWVVLGLSQAHMTQPYALVVEVHRTTDCYQLVIKYDAVFYKAEEVEEIALRQMAFLRRFSEVPLESTKLKDLLI